MLADLVLRRLATQRLRGGTFTSVVEAVRTLGAVQSQDFGGAKWAIGQRVKGATEADVDHAFDQGQILRTHVLRPTWHFVLPPDVRWMVELTAPGVRAKMAHYDRQLGIDRPLLRRVFRVLEATLRDRSYKTRAELRAALQRAKVAAPGQRLGNLLLQAEVAALIVSGPRRGKQHTWALLEERAPEAKTLGRDESLAALARRYFESHGPAQLSDFMWWSGLTTQDAQRGLALAERALVNEVWDGKTYWGGPVRAIPLPRAPTAHLLPNFDELVVGYRDRGALIDPKHGFDGSRFARGSILDNSVLVNGRVRGSWKRSGRLLEIDVHPPLSPAELATVEVAAQTFADFIGVPLTLKARVRAVRHASK